MQRRADDSMLPLPRCLRANAITLSVVMMLFPFAQLPAGEAQTLLSACLYYRHFNAHVKDYFIGAFPIRVYP